MSSQRRVAVEIKGLLKRSAWLPLLCLVWCLPLLAEDSSAAAGQGTRIVRPAGTGGPAFRTTENFRAILRWNQSEFFGLAVGLLSYKIAA